MFGCPSVVYSDKLPSLANPLENSYTDRISREVQMFNLSIIFEKGKRVALFFSYYCIDTVSPWKLNLRAHLHLNCLSSQEHLGLFHYNWKQAIMSSLFLENGFIRGINIISLSFFNLWFSYLRFSWFGVIIKKLQMKQASWLPYTILQLLSWHPVKYTFSCSADYKHGCLYGRSS